jgi:hypothetical protein
VEPIVFRTARGRAILPLVRVMGFVVGRVLILATGGPVLAGASAPYRGT